MNVIVPNQPYYYPQLHWWNRALQGKFIILDDVQHNSSFPSNRMLCNNNIKNLFLTIPVSKKDKHIQINKIIASNHILWQEDHLRKFESYYYKAPFFKESFKILEESFAIKYTKLISIILNSIDIISNYLDLNFKYIKTSDLSLDINDKNDRLIKLCNYYNCNAIIMGMGSKEGYVDNYQHIYNNAGIDIIYQNWKCPVNNFSILDSIANYGINRTREIIHEK